MQLPPALLFGGGVEFAGRRDAHVKKARLIGEGEYSSMARRAVARAGRKVSLHFLAASASLTRSGDMDGIRETAFGADDAAETALSASSSGKHGDKHKQGALQTIVHTNAQMSSDGLKHDSRRSRTLGESPRKASKSIFDSVRLQAFRASQCASTEGSKR